MSIAYISGRTPRRPVHGLDMVRLVAALLVVVYHLGFKAWAISDSSLHDVIAAPTPGPFGYGLTWCGWIGVQVFFVVSGAVIAYSADGASPGGFARRRLARLFPAVAIAVALALPVAVFLLGTAPAEALVLALKTIVFAPFGPWIMGQFWTIPIELAFYALIWALLASGAPGRGLRALPWGLGLASSGYWFGVTLGWFNPGGRLPELLLLSQGLYFALGMLCARMGADNLSLRHGMLALVCAGAAAVQVRTAAGWEMAERPELAANWLLPYAIWLALTLAVAAAFMWQPAIEGRAARHVRGLRMAGMTTYPLYLTHMHTGGATLAVFSTLGAAPALFLALATSLLIAWIIAAYLEPRLHGLVDGFLKELAGRSLRAG